MPIQPGNFINNQIFDYGEFVGSMAEAMDEALRVLMATDGLPALNMDPADQDVRHRRRLFVAIARGIARHLSDRDNSFEITLPLPANIIVTPDIKVDM